MMLNSASLCDAQMLVVRKRGVQPCELCVQDIWEIKRFYSFLFRLISVTVDAMEIEGDRDNYGWEYGNLSTSCVHATAEESALTAVRGGHTWASNVVCMRHPQRVSASSFPSFLAPLAQHVMMS